MPHLLDWVTEGFSDDDRRAFTDAVARAVPHVTRLRASRDGRRALAGVDADDLAVEVAELLVTLASVPSTTSVATDVAA